MPEENNLIRINEEINKLSAKVTELNQEKNKVIDYITSNTIKGIKKWTYYWIGGGIISQILMYFTIFHQVTTKSSEHISNSIKNKFAEPQITQTLNDVADNQAKEIIESKLNPAIEEATLTVNKKINSFEIGLQQFRDKYDTELARLSKEVEYLKNRNMVLQLSDKAIAEADAESFDKLENIYETTMDEDLKLVALSEIYRVKLSFINTTRIRGVEITYTDNRTGKVLKDKEIPTEVLIGDLNNNPDWRIRARATDLLKSRKEKQVPETLLNAIQNDKNLEVRAKAIKSFERVTGFKSMDVIKYSPAKNWWDSNKDNVDLKDLQIIQSTVENNSENKN